MDITVLNRGEKVAGIAGLLLILSMFIFDLDTNTNVGVFLGLIAAVAVTVGGWLEMQEEGTSFADETDRFRTGGSGEPGATPPGSAPPSTGP